MTLISSRQALDRICESNPDSPYFTGTVKVVGATIMGGLAYVAFSDPAAQGLYALGGAVAGAGSCLLADGVFSLANRALPKTRDGRHFQHNLGFVNNHTLSDRVFGRRVLPIEEEDRLGDFDRKFVAINGVYIRDTDLDRKLVDDSDSDRVDVHYIYTAEFEGEFQGQPLAGIYKSREERYARNVSDRKGTEALMVGKLINSFINLDTIRSAQTV